MKIILADNECIMIIGQIEKTNIYEQDSDQETSKFTEHSEKVIWGPVAGHQTQVILSSRALKHHKETWSKL